MIIKSRKLYITLICAVTLLGLIMLLLVQAGNIYPGAVSYEENEEIVTVDRGAWNTETFEINRAELDQSELILVNVGLTQIDQMDRAAGSSVLLLFIAAGVSLYVARVEASSPLKIAGLVATYGIALFIGVYVFVSYAEMLSVVGTTLDQMQQLS
ncbi:hypothetical protein [Alkalicoccus daliensis]|uniref:Uncharacterized protein n=1 Tax=Alkalicoccus daliensis TaxID=745820 RepID=A0A1H0DQV5_9BACI|nr:hypothetical protein [Alkalicoccus daliensis]SDN72361.1 hypothetical protein SAMN04488053_10345 [Alkalicoccus daliensis]